MKKTLLLFLSVLVLLTLGACGVTEPTETTASSETTTEFPVSGEETTVPSSDTTTVTTTETSVITTPETTEPVTSATTETTEPPVPVETPVTVLERICGENESILLAYRTIGEGELNSFEVNAAEFWDGCAFFAYGFEWEEFVYFPDIKNMFPEIYRITVTAPDGSEKIELSMFNNGGTSSAYVLYSCGDVYRNWNFVGENSNFDFISQFRREYFQCELASSDSSVDGWYGPEDACEYFVKTAYCDSRKNLTPGSDLRFTDYKLISFAVTGVNADKTAVSAEFSYAFKPDNWESPFVMVGNTRIGTDEYEHYLVESRGFILELGEDGRWHCTGIGTGGYKVS